MTTLGWPWPIYDKFKFCNLGFPIGKSEITFAACDLKVGRCRQLFELMKICEYSRSMSFLKKVLYVLCFYYAKISGERLQDHWSHGYFFLLKYYMYIVGHSLESHHDHHWGSYNEYPQFEYLRKSKKDHYDNFTRKIFFHFLNCSILGNVTGLRLLKRITHFISK